MAIGEQGGAKVADPIDKAKSKLLGSAGGKIGAAFGAGAFGGAFGGPIDAGDSNKSGDVANRFGDKEFNYRTGTNSLQLAIMGAVLIGSIYFVGR